VAVAVAFVAFLPGSAMAATMPPTISTSFGAASIPRNGSTSLSFAIGNPNFGTGLAGIGFTDDLPAGLVVATPNGQSGDCGGTVSAAAGSSSVSLSGGSLPAGSQCTISVNVTGTWGGEKNNSVRVSGGSGLIGNTSTAAVTVTVAARERVYWTNDNAISYINLDGSGGGNVTTTTPVYQPQGVALDPAAGKVYWASYGTDRISYANLDGSGGGDLVTTPATVYEPEGLALDPAGGKIYWAITGANKISFANLNGSGGGDLVTTDAIVYKPQGVALDPTAGKIYWTNSDNYISYANLNGTGGGELATGGATVYDAEGLALDPAAGKIYWANTAAHSISFANLNGTGGGDLTTTGDTTSTQVGVALDPAAGKIYWASATNGPIVGAGKISFAKLDDSGGGYLTVPYNTNQFPALLKPPAAAGAPVVTGGSALGSVLSCSQGTWAPDLVGSFLYRAPHSFAYRWSVNGAAISGASASTYTASEPGDYRCRVTASNPAGGTSQTSAPHTVAPPPSVSGFSPYSGAAGSTVVTISGSNLAGASAVKFNGLTARVSSDTATQISATLPNSATTGKISVTTPGGTATSASSFAVTFTLSAVSPASGPTGTDVTITGAGFTTTSSVSFNGVAATVLRRTPPSTLVAVVPASASTGKITVTNTAAPVGTVTSASSYTVTPHTPPTISSFTPTAGITGISVTITGTFFSGASSVKFGTRPAAYTIVSADQIKATVPNGASNAKMSVTTAVATATSTASFTPTLSITSFTPSSGPAGTDVTITGIGFTSTSSVKFNGVAATILSRTPPSQLVAVVPTSASTGNITVTNTTAPVGTVSSASSYTKT
jgi:hypothetical protein